MSSSFRVQVSKDYLVFASAHFITFRGHQCETLHGHNYRVGVAVEGAVDSETMFVLDFSVLKQITRKLVDEIDHKVLLPRHNPKLSYREEGNRIAVDYFGEPTYVFPRRRLRPAADPEQHRGNAGPIPGHPRCATSSPRADTGTSRYWRSRWRRTTANRRATGRCWPSTERRPATPGPARPLHRAARYGSR